MVSIKLCQWVKYSYLYVDIQVLISKVCGRHIGFVVCFSGAVSILYMFLNVFCTFMRAVGSYLLPLCCVFRLCEGLRLILLVF